MILLGPSGQNAELLFIDMLPWLGLLTVVVLLMGTIALWFRARTRSPKNETSDGYALSDLRRMLDSGELTQEEFHNAREAMIVSLRGSPTTDPGPSEGGQTPAKTPPEAEP